MCGQGAGSLRRRARFTLVLGVHSLKGKIDRIDTLPDGTVAVFDYKTGQAKEELGAEDKEAAPSLSSRAGGEGDQRFRVLCISTRAGLGDHGRGSFEGGKTRDLSRKSIRTHGGDHVIRFQADAGVSSHANIAISRIFASLRSCDLVLCLLRSGILQKHRSVVYPFIDVYERGRSAAIMLLLVAILVVAFVQISGSRCRCCVAPLVSRRKCDRGFGYVPTRRIRVWAPRVRKARLPVRLRGDSLGHISAFFGVFPSVSTNVFTFLPLFASLILFALLLVTRR